MSRRYVNWLLSLLGALLVVFSFAAARADGPVRTNDNLDRVKNLTGVVPPQKPLHHPKLDFRLAELSYRSQLKTPGFFIDSADHSLINQDGTVRAIAEALPQKANEAALAIERLGGIVEATFGNRTQFRSPPSLLAAIASLPQVSFVVPPSSVLPQSVTSQGVSVIRADQWHMKGYTGQGIKVGVLDLGFDGYLNLLGTELPNSVVAKSFRSDGDITGGAERHGTAVAEILHDVASGAELVLANFSTEVEMGTAVRWLIDQGVKIISASFGWLVDAPGDGTGIHNEIVATARSAGVLWVNAAGNAGRTHWSGIFNDSDGNNWHNFLGVDETNTIFLQADQAIRVSLRWNDWDKRDQDFNLYLYNSDLSSVVKSSTNRQSGSLPPTETFDYSAPADGNYHIAIFRHQANRNVDFDLFVHIKGDPEPCAVQASVGNGPQANGVLGSLRFFRDSVLNSTAVGKKYVSLFYKHSREIARMILSDSTLRVRMASLLETVVVPALRSLGKDEAKFVVTRETVDELKAVKQMVLGGATPALAADIAVAWQEVGLNNAEGKTTKELWEEVHSLAANVDPSSSTPGELEYVVSNRSIVIPADSPNALTIGATYWADDQLMDYSSRGPTLDGRIKPDVTGPTGVLTQTYGEQGMDEFHGTSSSTPHVSGAAALVWSLFPLHTVDEVQSYLETRAIDLGESGKDNLYGTGRVNLDPADVALPVLALTPASLNFGNVPVGSTRDLPFTVQNTGGGTLTGSASTSAPFSIVGYNSFSLGAAQSKTITVRFSPTSATTFNGNVSIASNAGNASVTLTGSGVPVVTLPTAAWTTPPPSSVTAGRNFTVAWTTTGSPTHVNIHWSPTDPLAAGCCLGAADTTDSSTVSPTSSPVTLTAPSKNADGTQIISPTTVKYVVHVSNSAGSGNSTVISITVNPAVSGPLTVIITGTGSGRVTSKPNGIDCGSTCVADFGSRRTVQLIAKADAGSLFIGWDQTRCTAKKPCAIILKETSQVEAKFIKRPNTTDPKIIYVAICGAGDLFQEACFEGKGWFDPRLEPTFGIFNPLNDSDLSSVATISSGLVSIGLRIGTLSPNSVILIASFSVGSAVVGRDLLGSNASIVTDFITALYNAGDKIYLVGHSYGGKITNQTAQNLRRKRIPVQMTAYIDAFPVFSAKVPDNVTRALNFFYPNDTEPRCPISGDSKIEAQKPSATEITNTPISRPEGPDEAVLVSCNPHTNMDNDPQVWRPILNYILQTIPK